MIAKIRPLILMSFVSLGSLISLATTAQAEEHRLIATDAAATSLVVEFGLLDQLVAIDVTSKLPEGAAKLPNIGYHRALSAEGLLSLNPTTVIGSEHMGPPETVAALKQANVALLQLPGALTTTQLRSNIQAAAKALGEPERGQQLLAKLDSKQAQLQQTPLANHRVAFILAMDPAKLRLAGVGTAGDALIQQMGAANVADYDNYRNVSAESLLSMAPTVILVAGRSAQQAVTDLLAANPVLAHTPAGQHQRLYSVNGATLVAGLSLGAIDEALRLQQLVTAAH
ncbi:ABC transporter substrate-binding protein [Neiella sp. HB171785]|uniref:ABC transporter substrate-binding protein n=1 Tax=Neiella litorisoli TaxID=2771431 RepID=A0A8J6UQH9_9GAMM|nr:ABC transporter substrate-binding protein [Neiella litorisoli]MBD1391322.1 ABC transporter substrate-binding protein [Neiella litorisoli]